MTDTAVKKSAESVKMPENGKKKHLSWQVIVCVCLVAVSVVLNVIAWKSTAFCDWYTARIFPIWENTYGRLTSLLPFSFGELLIAVAVFAGGYAGACDSQKRQEKENCENFRACLYVDSHFCGDGADL